MSSTMCVDRLVVPDTMHHHYPAPHHHHHHHYHHRHHHYVQPQENKATSNLQLQQQPSSPVNTFGKSNSSSSSDSSSSAGSSSPRHSRSSCNNRNSNSSSSGKSSSNNLNCKICSTGSPSNSQGHTCGRECSCNQQQQVADFGSSMAPPTPIKVLKSRLVELQSVHKASVVEASERHHQNPVPLSNNNEIQCPEYVVDRGTKTTYLKGRFLGKGGFARCYEMTDLTTNKVYAGKIIPKNRISKPYQKDKIFREISLHKQLSHKRVVMCHDYFEDNDNVYIILECCAKKSLVHVLKNCKRISEVETRFYMSQLIEGTIYIHSQNIIHRDLKLGNMLLDDDMNIKIADFGLATSVVEGEKKLSVCGTPNYIAPEVLTKLGHSFEVDVWAMGCVMYALLVGQPPFETTTLKDTYTRITNNKYSIPSFVSKPAANLIKQLLSPNPNDRPNLKDVLKHDFFTSNPLPSTYTPLCNIEPCFAPPPPSRSTPHHCNKDDVGKMTAVLSDVRLNEDRLQQPTVKFISPVSCAKTTSSKVNKKPSMKSVLKKAVPNYLKTSSPLHSSCKKVNDKDVPGTITDLYNALCFCLDNMKSSSTAKTSLPQPLDEPVTWITKWVDYSNKYGFGFHLSNKCAGVVFNDGSKLVSSLDSKSCQYVDAHSKQTNFADGQAPEVLKQKLLLLQYFVKYMDENLMEGGMASSPGDIDMPYVKTWFREWDSELIVMLLSNATLQINFIKDHSKLVLALGGGDGQQGGVRVMCCDEKRQCHTYSLSSLINHNISEDLLSKLYVARNKLKKVVEMDSTQV